MEDTPEHFHLSLFFLVPQTFLSGVGGDGYSFLG